MNVLRGFIFFQFIFQSCLANCPNFCNKHGTCGTDNTCTCYTGYTGLDCSSLICETGTAWTDKAISADSAHQSAECSNAGICDTTTGKCKCFAGYTGSSCQRLMCPNSCSNRGQCMSIRDASVYFGRDYSTADSAGDGVGFDYDIWDSRSIQICKCDYGFTGADCSQALCPKGDDPLTTGQGYRTLKLHLQTLHTITLAGELGITFHGETTFISLDDVSSGLCTAQLKTSPQFQDVTCEPTTVNRALIIFTLTFKSWPLAPKQNNLYSHDGNPPITDFYCDTSRVASSASAKCTFTDVVSTNIQEYEFCSGRGICNFETGDCSCIDGFGGLACQNITNRHSNVTNSLIAREVKVSNPDNFLSTAVRVNVQKGSNTDFQHIVATSNSTKHFEVRGDGLLGVTKLKVLNNGMTIARGGMQVESGGFTVSTDGAYVYSTSDTTTALQATSSNKVFTDNALELKSVTTTPSSTHLIQTFNRDVARFSVRGDGLVSVNGAGVEVTGGTTVTTGGLAMSDGFSVQNVGLKVTGGLTVTIGGWYTTNGLSVPQTGMKVTGGATLFGGLTVTAGGLTVTSGGADISAGGLVVTLGGGTITTGGLKTTDGLSVLEGGLKVTGGSTITTGGMKVTHGITIHDDGFDGTDGLSVILGGLVSTGGMSVNGGAKVTNGLTIYSRGMKVTSGVSIRATGLHVFTSGMTVVTSGAEIYSGGLKVTGGATVKSSGVTVTGGLTVIDTGLYVRNSGFTVSSSGTKVIGGATVWTNGLIVTGGVEVTGGVTIHDSGLKVASGMTVASELEVLANGATITAGGLKVAGGLTVHDAGLRVPTGLHVTAGLSIQDGGAEVTGGMTLFNTGMFVTANGGTVLAGGISVAGGLSADEVHVAAAGLMVTGGLTLSPNGLKVTGGLTYTDTGMIVTAGGLSVAATGLKITGGVSITSSGLNVDSGGLRITGGLTMSSTGLKVSGGATVTSTGLVVTANGASVTGGLKVANGVTVSTLGLHVDGGGIRTTGGLTMRDSSLKITGGLTLEDSGLVVSANGVTVAGGMSVSSGVTITGNTLQAPNIIITGGLSVLGGSVITGGLTVVNSGLKVDSSDTNYITGDSHSTGTLCIANNLDGFFSVPSDRRLKSEITPVKASLDSITKLRGVYFKWTNDSPHSKFQKSRRMGLIAQDVQKVFPDLISEILDGDYMGVNYLQLIPVMVEAIRELDESYTQLDNDYRQLGIKSQSCACRNKNITKS